MIAIIWIAAAIVMFVVLLITGLILIARRQARLLHGRMTGELNAVVDREGLEIDTMDFLVRRAIAIDHSRQVLVYIDCNGPEDVVELFDCGQIARCRIVRSGAGLREYRNGVAITDSAPGRIGLTLLLKNRTESFLEFYDMIKDGADERSPSEAKAVRWCGILSHRPAPVSNSKTN